MTKFKRLDIVSTIHGSQYIVTEFKERAPACPYIGVKVNGQGTQYKLRATDIVMKIGEATEDHPALKALQSKKAPTGADALRHATFCRIKSEGATDPAARRGWELLGKTPIGSPVRVLVRGSVETLTLMKVLFQGIQYQFAATRPSGRGFKFQIGALELPEVRSNEELLSALRGIECQLSPENLHCDGEISPIEASRRAAKLMVERDRICRTLKARGVTNIAEALYGPIKL